MQVLLRLIRFARKSPREQLQRARQFVRDHLVEMGWKIRKVPHLGNDRTAYVIGLYGTGRTYIISMNRCCRTLEKVGNILGIRSPFIEARHL
jgi:hypothetical protein